MANDDILQRLVEMLSAFFTEGTAVEEDFTYSLTSEFLRNIQDVLYTKQLVIFSRYEVFFEMNCKAMNASPEMYLRHVIYACLQINRAKTFEAFLAVLALLLRSGIEIRHRTKMNFCNLGPDAFMVIYRYVFKKAFRKCDGFEGFVKYINDPKYLEKNCIVRNIADSYNPNAPVGDISKDLRQKVFGMISGNVHLLTHFDFTGAENHQDSLTFAKKVLETTKISFPPKPSVDLNTSLSNLCPQKKAQIDKRTTFLDVVENVIYSELTSERCPSLCSDSKTYDDSVVQMEDNTRYEDIIEKVIRYNHSKSSCRGKTKADGILENLKCKINSLIQVLEEYDIE